jgi:hypothetical protein
VEVKHIMRYSEKKYDKKSTNPIQFIVFTVFMFLTSPIRFFSEIAKKIIYMGDYGDRVFKISIGLSGICTILVGVNDLRVYGGLMIGGKTITVSSLLFSTIILLVVYLAYKRFKIPVDLNKDVEVKIVTEEKKENEQEKPQELDIEKELQDSAPKRSEVPLDEDDVVLENKPMEAVMDAIRRNTDKTLSVELSNINTDKEVNHTDYVSMIKELPKEKIDSVFSLDRNLEVSKGIDILKDNRTTNVAEDLEFDEIKREKRRKIDDLFEKLNVNGSSEVSNSNKDIDDIILNDDSSSYMDLF